MKYFIFCATLDSGIFKIHRKINRKIGEFAETRKNIIRKWNELTFFIIKIIFLGDGTSNNIR